MLHIGLSMTKTEADIMREVMENNAPFFDAIFAMDESEDGTLDIIRGFPQVVYTIDAREAYPGQQAVDGSRQHLLEKAVQWAERYHHTDAFWFTLLHGDEIYYHDPRKVAELAEAQGVDTVYWHALQFFLHTSQQDSFEWDPAKSVMEQVVFYCPTFLETRQFRYRPGVSFNETESIDRAWPKGSRYRYQRGQPPVYLHYSYRSPKQIRERALDRIATGWQPYAKYLLEQPFRDILPGFYNRVLQWTGTLPEEFEGGYNRCAG